MSKWSVKCLAAAAAAGLMLGSVLPASAEESMIRQYETSQPVTSVVADVENADLVFQKGPGNTIQVDSAADARGEYTYHFDLEDGVLNIRVEAGEGERLKVLRGLTVDSGVVMIESETGYATIWENEITVTLPEKVYDQIEVTGKNSPMKVENVEADEITLEGNNGSAALEGTRSRRTQIQLVNGSIEFDHSYALDYDCEVRNGEIEGILSGTKADYRLEALVEHGPCNLANQAGSGVASGSFRVTNGSINLRFTG